MEKLNRRQLTASLLAGTAAASLSAPAAAQQETAGDDLLARARRQVESNRAALAKFPVPMAVEPASAFKA